MREILLIVSALSIAACGGDAPVVYGLDGGGGTGGSDGSSGAAGESSADAGSD